MIIMALDHTRDFFHWKAFTDDPLNLQTTSPALFMTRWITHFCAPVFVFLSGTSAYLQSLRKPKKELSGFLIKRGIWLVIAEFLIVTFAITFDPTYSNLIFQVIGAIGVSMVVLGLLIWLPFPAVFLIGLIIVAGHNSLDAWEASRQNNLPAWYYILHRPTIVPVTNSLQLNLFYPFLPWAGIMALGFSFGRLFKNDVSYRNNKIIGIGFLLIIIFVVLRWSNIYGDPLPWSPQRNSLCSIFSFINTQKYPPSLLYFCMTIGPSLFFLGLAQKLPIRLANIITVFGKVPFFYYILHFYLIHALSALAFFARGHSFHEGFYGMREIPMKFLVPGEGYSLGITYLVWILIVIILYPICKWYASYKQSHQNWWLSYL